MAAFMYRLGFQNAFLRDGNAFGAPAVLGTTDNQPLDIRVNNARVMRYEPNAISPNVIGGSPGEQCHGGGARRNDRRRRRARRRHRSGLRALKRRTG